MPVRKATSSLCSTTCPTAAWRVEDRPGSKPQFHSALGPTALGCSFLGGRGRGDTLPVGLLEDTEFSA